jgi:hypothetical protein
VSGQLDPDRVYAPFTIKQITNLNAYQRSGFGHPFTCGTDDCHDIDGERSILIATGPGWICPKCDYKQDWAHTWMANDSWANAAGKGIMNDVVGAVVVKPGEHLVVKFSRHLNMQEGEEAHRYLRHMLPGVAIALLDGGGEIQMAVLKGADETVENYIDKVLEEKIKLYAHVHGAWHK